MRIFIALSFCLSSLFLRSQSFEYVMTEIAGTTFNDVAMMDDKFVLATNVDFCHGAGITIFDTLGHRLFVEGLSPYYSIAPSICQSENGVYLLTFKNESEEFYDVTQMIIYRLDKSGNVMQSRIDTTNCFDFDGQILAANDQLLVSCGSKIYRYSKDLDLIDTFNLNPDSSSRFDYNLIHASGNQWTFIRRYQEYLIDSRPWITDQILVYSASAGSVTDIYDLSGIQGGSTSTDSAVYIYGADQYLRKFDLTTFAVADSLAWPDISEFKLVDRNEHTYLSAIIGNNRLGIYAINFSAQIVDTIWTLTSDEKLLDMVASEEHILLMSRLNLNDRSYRSMDYPILRKIPLSTPFLIQREEIGIEDVEVLQSYEKEDDGFYPEGVFIRNIPAIVGITVKNHSSETIHDFGYFSESIGGIFCASGRTTKYIEAEIAPEASFYFQDTIYPYLGPAVQFDLSFHVAAPNHKIDPDTTNNAYLATLFTTAVLNQGFKTLDIYPNPASGYIRLEGVEEKGSIEFFDVKGQLIRKFVNWSQELPIADLSPGLYLLKFATRRDVKYARLIKQ